MKQYPRDALAQDHFLCVNVIVDRVKSLSAGQTRALQQDFRHQFTAAAGKFLADPDVVHVIFKILTIEPAQILGSIPSGPALS